MGLRHSRKEQGHVETSGLTAILAGDDVQTTRQCYALNSLVEVRLCQRLSCCFCILPSED